MNKSITKKNEEFSIDDFVESNDILKKYSKYSMIKDFILKEFSNYKDDLDRGHLKRGPPKIMSNYCI